MENKNDVDMDEKIKDELIDEISDVLCRHTVDCQTAANDFANSAYKIISDKYPGVLGEFRMLEMSFNFSRERWSHRFYVEVNGRGLNMTFDAMEHRFGTRKNL